MNSLGRVSEHYKFGGHTFVVGESYRWSKLPRAIQREIMSQADDIEAHYGRDARALSYKLVMVPNSAVVRMLKERVGEKKFEQLMENREIVSLAKEIERKGLQYPPVLEEGIDRAFALARLGWDMPYLMLDEPFEMPHPTFVPTLEGRRYICVRGCSPRR